MGLFSKSPAKMSAKELARKLHDAGRTDQEIADAIGASRSQITRIRSGNQSGKLLRPRLFLLLEGQKADPASKQKAVKSPVQRSRRVSSHTQPITRRSTPPAIPKHAPARRSSPPVRSMAVGKTDRSKLLDIYSQLRSFGYDDIQAQLHLMQQRQEAEGAAKARKEAKDYEHAVEARVKAFMEPARRWLRQNAGYFTPAMVTAKAREMAEHDLHMRQTPRLPDEWTRAQIPAHSRS